MDIAFCNGVEIKGIEIKWVTSWAAAGVTITRTVWPDILMGLLIAGIFLSSAWGVIRASLTECRTGIPTTT